MGKDLTVFDIEKIRDKLQADKEATVNERGVKYVDLHSKKAFTKIFVENTVEFTVSCYKGYWCTLIEHLTFNENAIWILDKETKKLRPARTHLEVMGLLGIAKATYYQFYKELKGNGYIARFETGIDNSKSKFVINPKYALNGNEMPIYLFNLFNREVDEYQ